MFSDLKNLQDKVAIVTGASRGIGRAIAIRLAAAGASVVLAARDEKQLAFVAESIQMADGQSLVVSADLRELNAIATVVEHALEAFHRIDILVNNAGAAKRGDFLELTETEWQNGFALKFFGSVRLIRATWPYLKVQSGSIVNIVGVGGRTPGAEFSIGGSVNAALLSLTKALADRGVREGIQVNAINPGHIQTDRLTVRIRANAQKQGISEAEAAKLIIKSAKIARLGNPEDVANLTAFLVSPEARYLQGSLIDLDGGQTKTI